MKMRVSRIERMLEKVEATLVPPPRKCLSAIVHEGDDEAVVKEKQEKALAEHVARHPEDAGRTVRDFKWILWIVRRAAPRKSEDDTAEYIETLSAAREAPIGSGGNANGGGG